MVTKIVSSTFNKIKPKLEEGKLIQRALKEVYDEEKNARTEDLGGSATTSDFMAILLAKIEILFNKKSK